MHILGWRVRVHTGFWWEEVLPGAVEPRQTRWSPGYPAGSPARALSASLPLKKLGLAGTVPGQPPGVAGPELGHWFAAISAQDLILFSRGKSLAVKYT